MKKLLSGTYFLGVLSLLSWIAIYACPAFHSDYNALTQLGTQIRDLLIAQGIYADNASFNLGVGLTLIGMLEKLWAK